jgi:hypothetical protein
LKIKKGKEKFFENRGVHTKCKNMLAERFEEKRFARDIGAGYDRFHQKTWEIFRKTKLGEYLAAWAIWIKRSQFTPDGIAVGWEAKAPEISQPAATMGQLELRNFLELIKVVGRQPEKDLPKGRTGRDIEDGAGKPLDRVFFFN